MKPLEDQAFFNRPAQLTASPTHWTSRVAYTASLAEARHALRPAWAEMRRPLRHPPRLPRRPPRQVRRKSPTLLYLHRYSATASTSLSMRRVGVRGWMKAAASSLRGLCGVACRRALHAAAVAINTFLTSTTTRRTSRLGRRSRRHIK